MTPDVLEPGTRVFVDAPVFIYHFTGASLECRRLLERCEARQLAGVTSVVVLAEVTHRLMMIEAVSRGLVPAGNVARRLREKPEVVRQLHVYQEQVELIPLMGIDVVPLDLKTLVRSAELRRQHGLLTNDSLVAASAQGLGVSILASADADFGRVPGLELVQPHDLG